MFEYKTIKKLVMCKCKCKIYNDVFHAMILEWKDLLILINIVNIFRSVFVIKNRVLLNKKNINHFLGYHLSKIAFSTFIIIFQSRFIQIYPDFSPSPDFSWSL